MEPERLGLSAREEEDIRLMARLREGDTAAFSLLFQHHREPVRRFLYRLFWDRGKAEDGVQEVFLRLWLARRRYEPMARFTTFLYQIAQNYWRDECRKAKARPQEVRWAGTAGSGGLPRALPAPAAAEPQNQLLLRYEQWRIRQAIARLPEAYRVVFVLVRLEGRRLAEVAEILEIPLGTVKSRMHAAARLLRGWLESEEGEAER